MGLHARLILVGLAAAVALAVGTASAGARRFEVSNQQFRITFPNVGYRSGENVACAITLAGSFHSRTLSKVSGQLIGYINSAIVEQPCIEGSARFLTENLPWHIRYQSFSGVLPNIEQIKIQVINYSFAELCIGINCLFTSTATHPLVLIVNRGVGGRIPTMRWDETMRLFVTAEGGPCPVELTLSGTGEVFATGSTSTRINVRLVQ